MKSPAKLLLVENFDPAADYSGARVISLSPRVSYQLTLHKIAYHIPEEFYDEHKLREGEEAYFHEQLEWFGSFDAWLKNKITACRELDAGPARLYYNRIKYFVDSVIIQAYILRHVLTACAGKDTEIIYIRKERPVARTMQDFKFDEESALFGDLLPSACRKLGLNRFRHHQFERGLPEDTSGRVAPAAPPRWWKQLPFKRLLKGWQLSRLYGRQTPRSAGGRALQVLFMHAGSAYLDPPIKSLIQRGDTVYLHSEGILYCPTQPAFSYPLNTENRERFAAVKSECGQAARIFQAECPKLLDFADGRAGFDVRSLVLPYFEEFIRSTCAEMLAGAFELKDFFAKKHIDFVVSHTSSDLASKSALIAARASGKIPAACIQHGCEVFNDRVWQMTDIDAFDLYFSADSISQQHFQESTRLPFIRPCEIYQAPHYLAQAKARMTANRSKKPADTGPRRKRILYIPAKLSVHVRYFNFMVYPILWYYEFQKALLEHFRSRPDYEFIFKHARTRKKFADESIIPHIAQNRFENVSVTDLRTIDCFGGVDAVIVDRPTTAFFESVLSGLPVLAIYPDIVAGLVRSSDRAYFGESLQPFKTHQEAFNLIDRFLAGDPSHYIHDIPFRDDDFAAVLHEYKNRQLLLPHSQVSLPEGSAARR